jgi:hypothetical protein
MKERKKQIPKNENAKKASKALFLGFIQQRKTGTTVTGTILKKSTDFSQGL